MAKKIVHTKQEWFERAVRGLAKQGWRRSVNSEQSCKYLGENGARCAIGHGIGRAHLEEGRNARSLVIAGRLGVSDVSEAVASNFLHSLQRLHDRIHGYGCRELTARRENFVKFAKNRRLKWPADVPKCGAIEVTK